MLLACGAALITVAAQLQLRMDPASTSLELEDTPAGIE
jgi:hypothetical protein